MESELLLNFRVDHQNRSLIAIWQTFFISIPFQIAIQWSSCLIIIRNWLLKKFQIHILLRYYRRILSNEWDLNYFISLLRCSSFKYDHLMESTLWSGWYGTKTTHKLIHHFPVRLNRRWIGKKNKYKQVVSSLNRMPPPSLIMSP